MTSRVGVACDTLRPAGASVGKDLVARTALAAGTVGLKQEAECGRVMWLCCPAWGRPRGCLAPIPAQYKVLFQLVGISPPLLSPPWVQATILSLLDGVRSLLTSQSPPGSQSDLFAFQRSFKILNWIEDHPTGPDQTLTEVFPSHQK